MGACASAPAGETEKFGRPERSHSRGGVEPCHVTRARAYPQERERNRSAGSKSRDSCYYEESCSPEKRKLTKQASGRGDTRHKAPQHQHQHQASHQGREYRGVYSSRRVEPHQSPDCHESCTPQSDSRHWGGSRSSCGTPGMPSAPTPVLSLPTARRFRYHELQTATSNFSEDLVLGEGSFGKVYRGHVDEGLDGSHGRLTDVAVKKLSAESFQGYDEWLAEVLLLSLLRHPNLVRLVGFCAEHGDALLAYEFCAKGSLDRALFRGKNRSVLSWSQRVRVAQDAAKGLAYLHQNNVIHRDFKPSNILLAEDFSARLTDFGMARAGPNGDETHISTRVMGTFGYLDPAYMETGRLTRRTDTYAFGVMLLELLTGRRSTSMMGDGAETEVDAESRSTDSAQGACWVSPLLNQKKPDIGKLIDPRLADNYSKTEAVKLAIIAKHCIHDDPDARPEMGTLAEILQNLDKNYT